MNSNKFKELDEFVKKVDEAKKFDKVDLSADQDLSVAIMNLIGIEEHFFFSGAKTGKTKYYDLIKEVRAIRKVLLKKLIKEYEGEVWCISKHLLAASYRLMEVGTKLLDKEQKDEAYEFFAKAYDLYSLFWGLNLQVIDTKKLQAINLDVNVLDEHNEVKSGIMGKLRSVVQKVIDCCIE